MHEQERVPASRMLDSEGFVPISCILLVELTCYFVRELGLQKITCAQKPENHIEAGCASRQPQQGCVYFAG